MWIQTAICSLGQQPHPQALQSSRQRISTAGCRCARLQSMSPAIMMSMPSSSLVQPIKFSDVVSGQRRLGLQVHHGEVNIEAVLCQGRPQWIYEQQKFERCGVVKRQCRQFDSKSSERTKKRRQPSTYGGHITHPFSAAFIRTAAQLRSSVSAAITDAAPARTATRAPTPLPLPKSRTCFPSKRCGLRSMKHACPQPPGQTNAQNGSGKGRSVPSEHRRSRNRYKIDGEK